MLTAQSLDASCEGQRITIVAIARSLTFSAAGRRPQTLRQHLTVATSLGSFPYLLCSMNLAQESSFRWSYSVEFPSFTPIPFSPRWTSESPLVFHFGHSKASSPLCISRMKAPQAFIIYFDIAFKLASPGTNVSGLYVPQTRLSSEP